MTMEHGEDCCVKVAVHVRPLIGDEKLQGCKDCVAVVPGKPQVQIGSHSFTFDHVYGSTGTPSVAMFDECVAPLVDGLFQGYNATVLAYGQTGSGKTYTMGTACKEGSHIGIIPRAMAALFDKIESLKSQVEFQLRVSFIEILKEEVRDLLDLTTTVGKVENGNGHAKLSVPGKPPVQIREASNGVITLAGSTEVHVSTQKEMTACLEQGSLSRATGSTNMNNQSREHSLVFCYYILLVFNESYTLVSPCNSRSHAIFTITLEQMRKTDPIMTADGMPIEEMNEDYLCAKLHLVDLAGSERAKRTGSDGLRFKEGVHINRGLLALGNVISALGDEKKRKEGAHVPYRDSKLTRLLQDSLGGNSKTVMIACISPADINAEETLNTLKYANRARNIQNKPIVNRNPIADEMKRMRQQIEYLQAELVSARGGVGSDDVQGLRERISWLEQTNEDLCRELYDIRNRSQTDPCEPEMHKTLNGFTKSEGLKRSLQSTDPFDVPMTDAVRGNSKDIEDEVAKEWEHTMLQDSMGKELNELNRQLEQKESEMKMYGCDTVALKQHFGKKLMELEEEKRAVQQERDRLLAEVESLNADGQTHKLRDAQLQKLKSLEAQILDLKKKQENQVQLLKEKQKSDEAAKKLQEEIHFIKAQKVQLQHKIKQEAEQFRQWKATREKELLQLRKEGRRNEYERHKLQALNQRQKLVSFSPKVMTQEILFYEVLQRKTEEAAMATKRLKEILEARKSSARDNSGTFLCIVIWYLNSSVYLTVILFLRPNTLSPNATQARIASLESMVTISSNTLVAMASQLSEAEERERAFSGRSRWNQLRSMGEAKSLLQYIFNVAADARCQVREKEVEIKEMKEQMTELVGILRHSESRRREMEKQLKQREQTTPMATTPLRSGNGTVKHSADDPSTPLSPVAVPAQKQLKYSAGIVNSPSKGIAALNKEQLKMVPIAQLSMGKKVSIAGQSGKLWRWKRSHHQWLLQFKWKWQKPWKLSEMIRHSDETITRTRPRPQLLPPKPHRVM
ncbi:Kinesin-like protein KIN-4A [Dichanthelium oligosanthes]|uniref:Kinesin-like protein KIN-4A n=1 Tax=Dichanthelium oligosanthes TaxID=888268 RepID=A0A1E5W4Q2_9POAL|nr:Kinesin-like protein KIN-4A [Dichanthelium oligosanthes]